MASDRIVEALLAAPPGEDGQAVLVPHVAAAVPIARRAVVQAVRDDPACGAVVDEVAVVVSELLGNAVRHAAPIGGGDVLLRWRCTPGGVEVAVTDGGGGPVAPPPVDRFATSGRGLRIVASLARDWGSTTEDDGRRTVWARVEVPGALRRSA